jgi:hypothetical protein
MLVGACVLGLGVGLGMASDYKEWKEASVAYNRLRSSGNLPLCEPLRNRSNSVESVLSARPDALAAVRDAVEQKCPSGRPPPKEASKDDDWATISEPLDRICKGVRGGEVPREVALEWLGCSKYNLLVILGHMTPAAGEVRHDVAPGSWVTWVNLPSHLTEATLMVSLVVALAVFIFLGCGKLVLQEPSAGWRRIAAVSPFPAGLLVAFVWKRGDFYDEATYPILIAVTAALAVPSVLGTIRICRWIRDGFGATQSPQSRVIGVAEVTSVTTDATMRRAEEQAAPTSTTVAGSAPAGQSQPSPTDLGRERVTAANQRFASLSGAILVVGAVAVAVISTIAMGLTAREIGQVLGAALGETCIFLPITYFALRKYLKLRDLKTAWRPFGICLVVFADMKLFGLLPSADSVGMFFVVPFVVCAAVLYLSYRQVTGAIDE